LVFNRKGAKNAKDDADVPEHSKTACRDARPTNLFERTDVRCYGIKLRRGARLAGGTADGIAQGANFPDETKKEENPAVLMPPGA
jgi:hypothetical protein